jgi:hypothetical protein
LNAGWDDELLGLELIELKETDFDLDVLGFNPKELDDLLTGVDDEKADIIPLVPEHAVSRPGDVWFCGDTRLQHRVLCVDSTSAAEVARLLGERKPFLEGLGFDPSQFAGHSLRTGLATSAAAAGKSERAIMSQTGHRSLPPFEDISATAISSGKMPPRDWACKLQPIRLYPIFDRTRSSALRGHSAVPEPAAGVGAETNGSDRSSGFPPGILLRGVASTVY